MAWLPLWARLCVTAKLEQQPRWYLFGHFSCFHPKISAGALLSAVDWRWYEKDFYRLDEALKRVLTPELVNMLPPAELEKLQPMIPPLLLPKAERDVATLLEMTRQAPEVPWLESEEGRPLPILASALRITQPSYPPPVHMMPFLQNLKFAPSCQLTTLHPDWLRHAPVLSELDVRQNRLRTLPVEAASVRHVLMDGNPDLDLNGIVDWREYLQLRAKKSTPQRRLKLLLVGKKAVGMRLLS